MRGSSGFTLIEVVVAGGLLAIGVLAVSMLQARALQAQRRVAVVRELVSVAEEELYRSLSMPQPLAGECEGIGAAELSSCRIETEDCAASAATLCRGAASGATRVSVSVEREGQEFRLTAVHARFGR